MIEIVGVAAAVSGEGEHMLTDFGCTSSLEASAVAEGNGCSCIAARSTQLGLDLGTHPFVAGMTHIAEIDLAGMTGRQAEIAGRLLSAQTIEHCC